MRLQPRAARRAPPPATAAAALPPATPLSRVELVAATRREDPALRRGAFEGRAVDFASNEPVPGAELTFAFDGATATVRAGADGRFRFEPPQMGRFHLAVATADGFLPYAPELGRSPIELVARRGLVVEGIVVYLTPAIDYTGVVLSAKGEPVAGARVERLGGEGGETALVPLKDSFVTRADGTFHFHAHDDTVFEASHPEAGRGRGVLDGPAQVSHRLEIHLRPDAELGGAHVAGKVLDAGEHPLVGVRVRATPIRNADGSDEPVPGFPIETHSGDDGRFALSGLDARRYQLAASLEGYATARATVAASADDVTLVLGRGARIAGQVTGDGGEPVPAFTVVALRADGPLARIPVAQAAVFDGDGSFELTGLEAGDYLVVATAAGYAASDEVAAEAVPAPEDAPRLTVALRRGGTVSGVVRDSSSNDPIDGARVSTESRLGRGESAVPTLASVTTSGGGRFRLPGVAPGRASIVVAAYRHHTRIVTGIEVAAGATVGPVDVSLTPTRAGEKPHLEMAGIGVAIRVGDAGLQVTKVYPGSGGEAAGLSSGDVIVAVNGRSVLDLGFEAALERLRGPEGTQVQVSLRRGESDPFDVTVTRKKISL